MEQTVRGQDIPKQLIRIAKRFSPDRRFFVPCFGDASEGTNGKKPRCKGVKGEYRHDQLNDFPTMEILSVYLGEEIIVIDIDGKQAKNIYNVLTRNLSKLPETIYVSSDPVDGNRGAYFFRIPEKFKGIKAYSTSIDNSTDKLEFRTGKCYQAISGLHPKSGFYYSNNIEKFTFNTIPELPDDWCEYISNLHKVGDAKKTDVVQSKTKIQTLEMILELLDSVDNNNVSVENYDSWIRVGMVFHNIDSSDEGLEAWKKWSSKAENAATDRVFDDKWRSFNDRKNCITIGSIFFWLKQELEHSKSSNPGKISEIENAITKAQIDLAGKYRLEDREKIIREFKELELKGEALDVAMIRLSQDIYGSASPAMIETLWNLYHSEGVITSEERDAYAKTLLKALQDVDTEDSLDVMSDCYIVQLIRDYFKEQEIENYYYHGILAFLSCIGSILPKGLRFNFNQTALTPPIIYCILLGKAASGKNAVMNPFINPLVELTQKQDHNYETEFQSNERERFYYTKMTKKEKQAAYLAWCAQNSRPIEEEEFNAYKALDDMYPEPQRPHVFTILNFTPERGRSLAGEQRERGMLICQSELSNLLKTQSRYSSSASSDVTELLIAYDGDATNTERQGDKFRKSDKYQTSILSTIQPKVFEQHFNSNDDGNGFLSRCWLSPLETSIKYKLNDDPENPDVQAIEPIMSVFYQEVMNKFMSISWDNQLVIKHTLESKALWNQFSLDCEDIAAKFEDIHDGYYSFLRRMPEKVARLSMVINCVYYTCGIIEDPAILSVKSVVDAVKIGKLSISYAEKIYHVDSTVDTDFIDPFKMEVFHKIVLMASKKPDGVIPIRQMQNQQWRNNQDYIRAFFPNTMLKTMGKKQMIAVCEDAAKHDVGTWDGKNENFIVHDQFGLQKKRKADKKKRKKVNV